MLSFCPVVLSLVVGQWPDVTMGNACSTRLAHIDMKTHVCRRLHTAKDFPMSNGNPCDVNYDEDISAAAISQDIRQSVTIKL